MLDRLTIKGWKISVVVENGKYGLLLASVGWQQINKMQQNRATLSNTEVNNGEDSRKEWTVYNLVS